MKTELLPIDETSISQADILLRQGNIVAIPTETVYGLAADACNDTAIQQIFKVKGRPQDNPLIVHVSSLDMMGQLVTDISFDAQKLAEEFWPGPLTIILQNNNKAAASVSAGLGTIAIRMPAHKGTLKLIEKSGIPLAAPSANLSGTPSPTSAQHVLNDLNGKIPLILDGGACEIGLESTVISLVDKAKPVILRPGKITAEQISRVLGKQVIVDNAVLNPLLDNQKPQSPGTKYKHYAPKAELFLLNGSLENFVAYIKQNEITNAYALCFEGEENEIPLKCVTYGLYENADSQAQKLFSALRELDEKGAKTVYARLAKENSVNLALYNRLLRAAAFKIIDAQA